MTLPIAVLAAAAAAALAAGPQPASHRLRLLRPVPGRRGPGGATRRGTGVRVGPLAAAVLGGAGVALVLGGAVGAAAGAVAGPLLYRGLRRLAAVERSRQADACLTELPLALDLLAACVRSGVPTLAALEAVAAAVAPPLGARLTALTAGVRVGLPADQLGSPDQPAQLRTVTDALARAVYAGAALAPTVERLAARQRRHARAAGEARARAVAVWSVLPLAACFLPAFVLVSVVPVVVGLFGQLR